MNYNINIFGEIGIDTTAQGVVPIIQAAKADPDSVLLLNVYDSPGGNLFQGVTIFEELQEYKRATGKGIEGFGSGFIGSVTTLIFSAATERKIAELTDYFIHNPFVEATSGDAEELRKTADFLQRKQEELNKVYQNLTGLPEEDVAFMMNNPVILSADDAFELGFVTDVLRFVEVVNKYSKNMKKNFLSEFKAKMGLKPVQPEALALNLVNGTTAEVQTAGEEIAVGDSVTVEGQALEDGQHETQSGLLIQMKAGRIESLEQKQPNQEAQIQNLQNQQQVMMQNLEELQVSVLAMVDLFQQQTDNQARNQVSNGFKHPGSNIQNKAGRTETVKAAPAPVFKNMNEEMRRIREAAKQRQKKLLGA
jgi:ATP-dependent protease ClpP protease subunit